MPEHFEELSRSDARDPSDFADESAPELSRATMTSVIDSAEEFVRLRTSDDPAEYNRAARDEASESTWRDVIDRFPDMRFWVAQNKTVPLSVLEVLRHDPDERVRHMVTSKRSWARAHPDDTSRPQGLENTRTPNRRQG